MTQTISIEVPEGKVVKQETVEDGSIRLTFVDPEPVRSKSWEEFCQNHPLGKTHEYYINSTLCNIATTCASDIKREKIPFFLATREDAEAIVALIQLIRLHDEWVNDWKPSYGFGKEVTHYNIRYCGPNDEFVVGSASVLGRVLQFPTEQMALEFLKCFEKLIQTAKRFI